MPFTGCRTSRVNLEGSLLRRHASAVPMREGEEGTRADLPAHPTARKSPRPAARWPPGLGVPLKRIQQTNGRHFRRAVPERRTCLLRVGPLQPTDSVAVASHQDAARDSHAARATGSIPGAPTREHPDAGFHRFWLREAWPCEEPSIACLPGGGRPAGVVTVNGEIRSRETCGGPETRRASWPSRRWPSRRRPSRRCPARACPERGCRVNLRPLLLRDGPGRRRPYLLRRLLPARRWRGRLL